jgi:hypothetical protein
MAGLLDRWMAIILVIAVAAFAWNLIVILPAWPMTRGFEAEWVGWALAAHEGFSFGESYRWLFTLPPMEDVALVTSYSPTAWVDPIFPFIHAGAVWLFGDHARLTMAIFCLALFLSTAVVAAILSRHLAGRAAGLLCFLVFLINDVPVLGGDHKSSIVSSAVLAGFLLISACLYLFKRFESFGIRDAIILGVAMGVVCLVTSICLILIPTMAVLLCFWVGGSSQRPVRALLFVLAAVATLSPWIARNYLEFGHLVPVRSGGGQIAHMSTVAMAAVTSGNPDLSAMPEAPWRADSELDAIVRIVRGRGTEARAELERWQLKILSNLPDAAAMNEVERDQALMKQTVDLIFDDPGFFIRTALYKQMVFWAQPGAIVGAFTMIGIALSFWFAAKERRIAVLLVLGLAYASLFTILVAFFYRYREPIEPILIVLSSVCIISAFQRFRESCFRAGLFGDLLDRSLPGDQEAA